MMLPARGPQSPPTAYQCQPAPAVLLPPVIPRFQGKVTARHRWSAARRHRQPAPAVLLPPVIARFQGKVTNCHR